MKKIYSSQFRPTVTVADHKLLSNISTTNIMHAETIFHYVYKYSNANGLNKIADQISIVFGRLLRQLSKSQCEHKDKTIHCCNFFLVYPK